MWRYLRDSQGIPEILTFDFEAQSIRIDDPPMAEVETWNVQRDVIWLWRVLGQSASQKKAA